MRLDKYLADMGQGTRKEIKEFIKKGLVTVNSAIIKDPSFSCTKEDAVTFMGQAISYEPFIYLMMNKPKGVISATTDKEKKTVISLLSEDYKNFDLFPCGRLDIDTVGLLLITNNGELAHKALSPKHHVEKTYYLETEIPIKKEYIKAFSEGVYIPGGTKTLPASLEILGDNKANLTIFEGKFHQVKYMFEAVGNKITYLKRIKFGNLTLDPSLKEGEYRPLFPDETIF